MTQLKSWSHLYGISEAQLALMQREGPRADSRLAYQILHTNSVLVQQFLSTLPPPRYHVQKQYGIFIGLIFPSALGWQQFYATPSKLHRSQKSSFLFTRSGIQVYEGKVKKCYSSVEPVLGTAIDAVGLWPQGLQYLTLEFLVKAIEKKYFISSCGVGSIEKKPKAGELIVLEDEMIRYKSHGQQALLESGLEVGTIERLWKINDSSQIPEKVQDLNTQFFH